MVLPNTPPPVVTVTLPPEDVCPPPVFVAPPAGAPAVAGPDLAGAGLLTGGATDVLGVSRVSSSFNDRRVRKVMGIP